MRHVLLATDGSEGANRAADIAIVMAKAFRSSLFIVTVTTPGDLSGNEIRELTRAEGSFLDALEGLSNEILLGAQEKAHASGITKIRTHRCWGDPAQAIIEIAQQQKADTIVIGKRGRGQLAGLILGSVSQKVSSVPPCVTIIVP